MNPILTQIYAHRAMQAIPMTVSVDCLVTAFRENKASEGIAL